MLSAVGVGVAVGVVSGVLRGRASPLVDRAPDSGAADGVRNEGSALVGAGVGSVVGSAVRGAARIGAGVGVVEDSTVPATDTGGSRTCTYKASSPAKTAVSATVESRTRRVVRSFRRLGRVQLGGHRHALPPERHR